MGRYELQHVCMHGQHLQQSMDQPHMVDHPARGQLNKEDVFIPVHVGA